MKIAITGHRPNKLNNDYDLTGPLIMNIKAKLSELIVRFQPDYMISGMALGIDTLWAELSFECNAKLIACIPDTAQPDRWPPKSQTRYYRILDKAYQVVNVSNSSVYHIAHLQKRNEYMVDLCDLLIAVWDCSGGGTANCVNYCVSKEKDWIHLNPTDMTMRYNTVNPENYMKLI